MKKSRHSTIEFNVITVPDAETHQHTAFFAQFPQAIAIGDTENEAIAKLIPLVDRMLRDKREEVISELRPGFEYSEKSINAQFAYE